MKSMKELWTPVLINGGIFKDNYLVSNFGRVKYKRHYKKGSYQYVLMDIIDSKRPVVKMSGNGRTYVKSVAKLVLSSFQYREGCECANITYLDGNMKNCSLSNLRYTADKNVFTAKELKQIAIQKKKVKTVPVVDKNQDVVDVVRSCSSCKNNPCFTGMDNLSTDFGAVGCTGWKQKETN